MIYKQLYSYWWKIVLVAMRQQDKLVHDNPNDSLGRHMLQMMEHVIQLFKKHCRRNCNHRNNILDKVMQYIDCVTIGAIGYDLIDFKYCQIKFEQHWKKIFDPHSTPYIEHSILKQMPQKFRRFQSKICDIQFRDPIDVDMSNIWKKCYDENNQFDDFPKNMKESNYTDLLDSGVVSWDDDDDDNSNDGSDSAYYQRASQSQQQLFASMQQISMQQSQSQSQSHLF